MRKPSACNTCRARRRKCIYPSRGQGSSPVCEYCRPRGLCCIQGLPEGGYYAKREAKLQERGESQQLCSKQHPSSTVPTGQHLPSMPLRLELVNFYFDYIHGQFHSMYHRPSFVDHVQQDRVPDIILFAIFALSSRFSDHDHFAGTDPRARGERYREAGERLLDMRAIVPTTIQACVLLGAYAAASGDTDVENLYYSMAGRICLVLDLPNRPVETLIEREINIRTWWTLCMIDVWSSTAVRLPRIMPVDSDVPLPMDEIAFSLMDTDMIGTDIGHAVTLEAPLLAEMIKLNRILARIIDFNRQCVSDHLEGAALDMGMCTLTRELDEWLENLPPQLHDTPENFQYFASLGLGRIFVAVYLGYYHYGQLLNYQFLSCAPEATSSNPYTEACKFHAAQLCSLVYRSFSTPGSEVLYSAVSHILVIASTVQIHTLLFSSDDIQIRISKSRLERNFEILLRLRTYWPSVDGAMSRLRAFHQTCLRSKDKETSFVLDRWLLKFLVQFAPDMESEPRDNDPEYEALLALSKRSPLAIYTGMAL